MQFRFILFFTNDDCRTEQPKMGDAEAGGVGYGSIPQADEAVSTPEPSMKSCLIAELFGTCTLVQIGCGGICAGLYMGALNDVMDVAFLWLLGATLAIYATASTSGAHLNPAVSFAFAIVRPDDFSWSKLIPYWAAQLAGGLLAGALNLMVFGTAIKNYEKEHGLVRGEPDSIKSASAFGDYWSLSAGVGGGLHAVVIEAFGTAFLTFVIFSATNPKNNVPSAAIAPIVGTGIGMMIALLGTLTGAGINPARDLGPRLVTNMAGWGRAAMTNWGAYIFGPLIGGPLGAFLADKVLFV